MHRVAEKLQEYGEKSKEIRELPPSDEKADALRIMTKILDMIIKVDYRLLKKRPVDELEEKIAKLYTSLPTKNGEPHQSY